jgi:hypothetical protein
MAVLIGASVNLLALAVAAFRGRRRRAIPPDARFSADSIGVLVVGGDLMGAEAILGGSGAVEVRRVG